MDEYIVRQNLLYNLHHIRILVHKHYCKPNLNSYLNYILAPDCNRVLNLNSWYTCDLRHQFKTFLRDLTDRDPDLSKVVDRQGTAGSHPVPSIPPEGQQKSSPPQPAEEPHSFQCSFSPHSPTGQVQLSIHFDSPCIALLLVLLYEKDRK